MGPYLYFRVLIFTFLASFTQRMSIQSARIQQWFRFKLLANFDFYLCLRINFHTSSFRVLIFAASGPYWVLISQKDGSLSQSLGVFISFRGRANTRIFVPNHHFFAKLCTKPSFGILLHQKIIFGSVVPLYFL